MTKVALEAPGPAGAVLVVWRLTLKEATSRRLVLAGTAVSGGLLALYALGFWFLRDEAVSAAPFPLARALGTSVLTVTGLYVVQFMAAFLAFFLSVGCVSAEAESGTLHALLGRPLPRWSFLVGRWAGFATVVGTYVAAMSAATLVLSWALSGYSPTNPWAGVALLELETLLLLSVSMLGSTLAGTLANGIAMCTLFGASWLAGAMGYVGRMLGNDALRDLATAIGLAAPSDGLWRGASYYLQSPSALQYVLARRGLGLPFTSLVAPAPAFLAWSALYLAFALLAALAHFQRRDL